MVQAKGGPRLVEDSSEMLNINCLEHNDTYNIKIKCSFKAMPVGIKFTDMRWTPDEMANILVR